MTNQQFAVQALLELSVVSQEIWAKKKKKRDYLESTKVELT